MKIIGITGTIGAGKGTVVDYLIKNKGFAHYSVREFLKEEIQRRDMTIDRDSMVQVANDLRAEHSPSYIVEQLYERAKASGQDCVMESLRTPGEVEALKRKGNFQLIAVDADPQIRYDRIISRNNETDRISFETFQANESREMHSDDPNKQNLSRCISMAEQVIINNGTIEDLHKKMEEIINEYQS